MKLSSLDIRKQEFSRALRGYDPDEVDSFLDVLSEQWKDQVDELKRANDRISELELKLEHYLKVEEALEEALQTARSSARQTLEQAESKARSMIAEAEDRADDITREAEERRRQIKRETTRFTVRRKEVVAKLRAFLISEMEMLAHYDGDAPTGYIKLVGAGQEDRGAEEQDPAEDRLQSEPPPDIQSDTVDESADIESESIGARSSVEPDLSSDEKVSDTVESDESDALADPMSDEPTWKVHRMVDQDTESSTSQPAVDDSDSIAPEEKDADEPASDEIKKIRRILEDLDR